MDKAKVDAIAEFQVFQPFFDACGAYYGDGFIECLKQVRSVYLDLDLSQIIIYDTILPTPRGDDTVSDEPDDSAYTIEQEAKYDGVVIAQLVPEGPVFPVVSSIVDSSAEGGPNVVNPTILDAPPS